MDKALTPSKPQNMIQNVLNENLQDKSISTAELFTQVYEQKIIDSVRRNRMFEYRYFSQFEAINPESYQSLRSIFIIADECNNTIIDLKINHGNLITNFVKVQNNIKMFYDKFVNAIAQNANSDQIGNIIRMMNISEIIQDCNNIVNKLNNIKNIKVEDQDISNLSKILVTGITHDDIEEKVSLNKKEAKRISDEIIQAKKDFSKINQEKSKIDPEYHLHELKIKQITEILKAKDSYKKHLKEKLDELNKNVKENDEQKKRILNQCNKQIIEINKQENKNLVEMNIEYKESLKATLNEAQKVMDDIKDIKVINKNYSIIFILDESGSMSPFFKTVKDSVFKIIEKRKNEVSANDKISIIKFNDEAYIECLNMDLREEIQISEMRGGGTSFLKPLEKLENILSQTDKDQFIPMIFFLSDGYGEPQNEVLDYCERINKSFPDTAKLFFSVGFGDADAKTLEKMAQVFNNGMCFLNIGNEICKLYHHVKTQNELLDIFKKFEKLFKYQKNLIELKKKLYEDHIKQQNYSHNFAIESLNTFTGMQRDTVIQQFKSNETNINSVIVDYEEGIKKVKMEIEHTDKIINDLELEKKDSEDKIRNLHHQKEQIDSEHKQIGSRVEKLNKDYNNSIQEIHNMHSQIINSLEKNEEENFTRCIENLKKMNMAINKDEINHFKLNHKNFSKYVLKFIDQYDQMKINSHKILNVFKTIINDLNSLDQYFNSFNLVSIPGNMANLIWDNILEFFEKKYKQQFNKDKSDFKNLQQIIEIKIKTDDDDDEVINEALNLIWNHAGLSIFEKMETQSDYIDSFRKELINVYKKDKTAKEDELGKLEKKSEFSEEEKTKIKSLNAQIDKLDEKIENIKDQSIIIRKILNGLIYTKNEAKDYYIKKNYLNDLNNLFHKIVSIFPDIDNMKIEYYKNA